MYAERGQGREVGYFSWRAGAHYASYRLRNLGSLGAEARWADLGSARRVYGESVARARRASLYWLWAGPIGNKNVDRLVALVVWESRDDPACWGVRLGA